MIAYAFHPEAEAELAVAAAFYESPVEGLGRSFAEAIQRTIAFICEYPEAGGVVGRSLRRMLARGFPYAVIYQPDSDLILIPAIAHLRRRPGYWRTRE